MGLIGPPLPISFLFCGKSIERPPIARLPTRNVGTIYPGLGRNFETGISITVNPLISMKSTLYSTVFVFMVALSSCKSDSTSSNSDAIPPGVTTTIKGKAWTASTYSAAKSGNRVTITASAADNSTLTVQITTATDTTTGKASASSAAYTLGSTTYVLVGPAILSKRSVTHMEGTFEMKGNNFLTGDTLSASNGTFNVDIN